jgi:drug/metabolite transporter (DMT)-like permease
MASSRLLGGLYLFLAAAFWGGTYVATKYVLAGMGPFALVLVRYAMASLVLVPLLLLVRVERPSGREMRSLALLGFVGLTLTHSLQFAGTALSSAHAGSLLTSSSPVFMVLFAALLLSERITVRMVVALVLAGIGVIAVIGPGGTGAGPSALVGDVLLVAAGVTWALYSVLVRRYSARVSSFALTTYVSVFGALFALPLGVPDLLRTRPLGGAAWLAILYVGLVSTILAYYLWNRGLQLIEAGAGSVFFFAQPLTGTFFAWLLLREQLTAGFFLGAALILAGVAVALLSFERVDEADARDADVSAVRMPSA